MNCVNKYLNHSYTYIESWYRGDYMGCPNIEVCPYINGRNENEIIEYKNKFCNSDYFKCARFTVGNITGEVPDDLRPDDFQEAEKIVASGK